MVGFTHLGDCLEIMKSIQSNKIDMILTDLPYGVTTRNGWDHVIPMDKLWKEWNRIKKETTPIILTSIQPFTSLIVNSNLNSFKYEWVWRKPSGTGFLNAKKQPLRNHEQVVVFYDKQCTYNPQFSKGKPYKQKSGRSSLNYGEQVSVITENDGRRYPLSVLDIEYDKTKLHPTQKPVELFEYLIKTYSNEENIILDCCAGSGTTAIACLNTNRNYICVEKEKQYFDIMEERIKNHVKPTEICKPW